MESKSFGLLYVLLVIILARTCSVETNLEQRMNEVRSACDNTGAAVELQDSIASNHRVKGAVVTPEMRKNIEKCVEAGKTAEIKFDSGLVLCTSKSVGGE